MDVMAAKVQIRWAQYPSPLGVLRIAASMAGITDLVIGHDEPAFISAVGLRHNAAPVKDKRPFAAAFKELDSYFEGRPTEFSVPVDLSGSDFDITVWQAIRSIPWGRSLSYSALALRAGAPGAARAVGGACGRNPVPIIVPCHRVLAASGALGGYTGGLDIKRRLLSIEGYAFRQWKA